MGYKEMTPVEGHEELPSNSKAAACMAGLLEVVYTGINYATDGGSMGDAALLATPYAMIGAALTPYVMKALRYDCHIKRCVGLSVATIYFVGGAASNFMRDGIEHMRDPDKPNEVQQEEIIHVVEPPHFVSAKEEMTTPEPSVMLFSTARAMAKPNL